MSTKPFTSLTPCGLALIGEAPGEEEEKFGLPFVGASGQELTRILSEAGITREQCHITNVFVDRPPNNNLDAWCLNAISARQGGGGSYPYPPLSRGRYIAFGRANAARAALKTQLEQWSPKVAVCLGATACWALLDDPRITAIRGTVLESKLVPGLKVLPTFHPAYILRQWSDRPVMIADLIKAKKELDVVGISRPNREIIISPEIQDLGRINLEVLRSDYLTVDIETARGQITCIGFGLSKSKAIVIPFVDRTKPNYNYWSAEDEPLAMHYVRAWLESSVPKIFQNGLYDIQYLWRIWHVAPKNCLHDTMLLHHSLQPEMKKSLGFLGSIYTTEAPWKLMRKSAQDTIKRDE